MEEINHSGIGDRKEWDKTEEHLLTNEKIISLRKPVENYVRSLLNGFPGARHLAEELTQDVMVKILEHRNQQDPNRSTPEKWALSIAHNTVMMFLRKANASRHIDLDPRRVDSLSRSVSNGGNKHSLDEHFSLKSLTLKDSSTGEIMEDEKVRSFVESFLETVENEKHREIFRLACSGLGNNEIKEELKKKKIDPNGIKIALNRLRGRLIDFAEKKGYVAKGVLQKAFQDFRKDRKI